MIHNLIGGKDKIHSARCGYDSEDRSEFSGWHSKVTCHVCLDLKEDK